jgi:malonyl-CoA/methylmalonyl-CoA synthetase
MAALRAQRVWQLATIQPAVNSINCRRQLASLPPLLRHCFTKLEDTSKFGVVDQGGTRAVSYESLHQQSISVAHELLGTVGSQQRVGFLLTPDSTWLATLFGVWLSGNTAVPLCTKHSLSELEYVLTDAEAAVVITDQLHQELATDACKQAQVQSLLRTETILSTASQIDPYQALPSLPTVSADDDGLVIYTSGTTSKPKGELSDRMLLPDWTFHSEIRPLLSKDWRLRSCCVCLFVSWLSLLGVLTTHGTIHHQIQALHTAWRWTPSDVIINVLPLHHVHGVLNVVLSSAAIGATVEMCSGFDPSYTFDRYLTICIVQYHE